MRAAPKIIKESDLNLTHLDADFTTPKKTNLCQVKLQRPTKISTRWREFGTNDSTCWLIFELLWRDFFRFMFKKHQTKFFLYSGIKTDKINEKSLNEKLLSQWINGNTNSVS